MKSMIEQKYWDDSYKGTAFSPAKQNDVIRKWLEEYAGDAKGTCFEVGCFPGTYLAVFGEMGFALSGVDLNPGVDSDLPSWLNGLGHNVEQFHRADFFAFVPSRKYDVVCSFGFLEHFLNWEDALLRHVEFVAPNGLLIISVPNFLGYAQRLIHFYLNRENYRRHNVNAMRPEEWREILEPLGFETIFCGPIGGFDFWVDGVERGLFQKALLRLLSVARARLKSLLRRTSRHYSPYCGLVMRRTIT